MNTPEFNTEDPRQYALEILNQSSNALREAVSIISPETPDADPLDVFPAPQERRADDEGIGFTPDQEKRLRATAAELGFGRSEKRTVSELGLSGGHVIIEGGQSHKMLAEALLVSEDESSNPASIIITASPNRQIKEAEQEVTARVLGLDIGEVASTEYEVAKQVAEKIPGFEKAETETQLPYDYDIDNNFQVSDKPTGQLSVIGKVSDTPILLLRVDREDYVDEEGKSKYRKQPDTAALITIVDSVLRASGDETNTIAFVTSGTYQPSREVDGARASLSVKRIVGIPTYGTALLAKVKGEPIPAPGPINQLPGELHKMALQVKILKQLLEA